MKEKPGLETDPRFPSGPWAGFFMQPAVPPGKHQMEIKMTFRQGRLTAEGRDRVGSFTFDGVYDLASGKCEWIKQYPGKHAVIYRGFNEGKGIWGKWELADSESPTAHGGFHIWPEDTGEPSTPALSEEADLPAPLDEVPDDSKIPELVPVGRSPLPGANF